MISLKSKRWYELAQLCPLRCEVAYAESDGLKFKAGRLTAVMSELGWTFHHPGFKNGMFHVGPFKSGDLPEKKGIHIRPPQG